MNFNFKHFFVMLPFLFAASFMSITQSAHADDMMKAIQVESMNADAIEAENDKDNGCDQNCSSCNCKMKCSCHDEASTDKIMDSNGTNADSESADDDND